MSRMRIAVAALSLSAAGFVSIALREGYTDTAVIPVTGDVPTIGFGTTGGVKMGDRIQPPQAVARALRDVTKFEGAIKRCVTVPLTQGEFDAYSSLAYNIGPTAFCNSTLVRKLNAEDYAGACAEISRWDKQGGKALRGLTVRRAEERAMCEGKN
jgi:lysozyme